MNMIFGADDNVLIKSVYQVRGTVHDSLNERPLNSNLLIAATAVLTIESTGQITVAGNLTPQDDIHMVGMCWLQQQAT